MKELFSDSEKTIKKIKRRDRVQSKILRRGFCLGFVSGMLVPAILWHIFWVIL